MLARLSVFFGVSAALLSAIGLYGLMAYTVVQRTPELGIRLAVGARRATVLAEQMRSALRLAAAGILIGIPATLIASRAVEGMLFGVAAGDIGTIAGVSVALVAVATCGAAVPAYRASRVDPTVALRHD
jgi:ABC-type antimicrobial peptide transport system permease subunit